MSKRTITVLISKGSGARREDPMPNMRVGKMM
jgi:hypothetical protein